VVSSGAVTTLDRAQKSPPEVAGLCILLIDIKFPFTNARHLGTRDGVHKSSEVKSNVEIDNAKLPKTNQ
jgi:hypothetical protein